jgi:hypothetical protein
MLSKMSYWGRLLKLVLLYQQFSADFKSFGWILNK